jgi:lipopolysaccharide export LptBFGC system permease protein LptF
MLIRFAVAGAVLALTGVVHVAMGGPEVYDPLNAVSPSAELALYLALLWHFATAFFVLGAIGMVWASFGAGSRRQTAVGVALLMLAMGGLFFIFGISHLGEVWTAPQWVIALVVGALVFWPQRRPA